MSDYAAAVVKMAVVYSVSQKKFPLRFSDIFPQTVWNF